MKSGSASNQLLDKRDFWILPCKRIGEYSIPFRDIGGGKYAASYLSIDPSMMAFCGIGILLICSAAIIRAVLGWGPPLGQADLITMIVVLLLIIVLFNRGVHHKTLTVLRDGARSEYVLTITRLSLLPVKRHQLDPLNTRISSYRSNFYNATAPSNNTTSRYSYSICIEDNRHYFMPMITDNHNTWNEYLANEKCLQDLPIVSGGYINIKTNLALAAGYG